MPPLSKGDQRPTARSISAVNLRVLHPPDGRDWGLREVESYESHASILENTPPKVVPQFL